VTTTTWVFPYDLVTASAAAMRPHGLKGHEGLALWFGRDDGGQVTITHLIVPYGPGLMTQPLQLKLSLRAMARITRLTDELQCYWAGQIHSHPGLLLNLSDVDMEMGVRVQDYLSVVCPYYAQRNTVHVDECGVHLFDEGRYRRLGTDEVAGSITTSPQAAEVVYLEVSV